MSKNVHNISIVKLLTSLLLVFSMCSQAALINRGGGLIYDNVLDITWMQNANYFQTSGADSDGRTSWALANNWVNNLEFAGYDDWRLPTVLPLNGTSYDWSFSFNGTTDRGFNNDSTRSELGHLFYQSLNNISFFSPLGTGPQPGSESFNSSFTDAITGETFSFENIGQTYWASPANNPFSNAAWAFNLKNINNISTGEQQIHGINASISVWAVRNGDSSFTPPADNNNSGSVAVPEPAPLTMLVVAISLILLRLRTKAQ